MKLNSQRHGEASYRDITIPIPPISIPNGIDGIGVRMGLVLILVLVLVLVLALVLALILVLVLVWVFVLVSLHPY